MVHENQVLVSHGMKECCLSSKNGTYVVVRAVNQLLWPDKKTKIKQVYKDKASLSSLQEVDSENVAPRPHDWNGVFPSIYMLVSG